MVSGIALLGHYPVPRVSGIALLYPVMAGTPVYCIVCVCSGWSPYASVYRVYTAVYRVCTAVYRVYILPCIEYIYFSV